jgi:hypothetical protein
VFQYETGGKEFAVLRNLVKYSALRARKTRKCGKRISVQSALTMLKANQMILKHSENKKTIVWYCNTNPV